MMKEVETITVNIEADIKESAEAIFARYGLSASEAVRAFYLYVIKHKAIPAEIENALGKPLDENELTEEEILSELEKGYEDIVAGRSSTVEEAFEEITKRLGL